MTATSPKSHLISCCHCSSTLTLLNEHLGQPVQCPKCSNYFQADLPPAVKQSVAKDWYVLVNGQRMGPVSAKALVKLAAVGKLRPETWLARGTSDVWVKAARVKGLKFRRKEVPARPGETRKPMQKPVASAKKVVAEPTDLVTCDCPHCAGKCRIPRPMTPAAFACPTCKQPFRAANTSVGVVCQRTSAAHQNTVHHGSTSTRMQ